MKPSSISGNVLVFILIGIFLLGGLTAVFVRSSSNSEYTGKDEKLSVKASEIISYLSSIQAGVDKLMLRGCSESNLSFGNNFYRGGDELLHWTDAQYPKAPSDKSCHIFDVKGAGVTPKAFPPQEFGNHLPSGDDRIESLELVPVSAIIPGIGTNAPELLVYIPFLDMNICNEINRKAGIGLYSGDDPTYVLDPVAGYAPPPILGTTGEYNNNVIADEDAYGDPLVAFNNDLKGKKIFCAANTISAGYADGWSYAFAVLIVR
jgi:hypothetical protein